MEWSMQHLISATQFTNINDLYELFNEAELLRCLHASDQSIDFLNGKIVATAFYERSTRTRLSFEAAAHLMGAKVISETSESSSVGKGERIEDSIRTISQYAKLVVMRHPSIESVQSAANFSYCPVINGGNGNGEHPTQALLDLYTVWHQRTDFEKGFNIMFCGDLANGRPIHSWMHFIRQLLADKVTVYLAPATGLKLPVNLRTGVNIVDMSEKDIIHFLPTMDVVYMTRIQKERMGGHRGADPNPLYFDYFKMRPSHMVLMKNNGMVLHPLPRNEEIHSDCDTDHRALYHTVQVTNGLYARMAMLRRLLNGQLFAHSSKGNNLEKCSAMTVVG